MDFYFLTSSFSFLSGFGYGLKVFQIPAQQQALPLYAISRQILVRQKLSEKP